MGGGGGVTTSTRYQKANAPDVYNPVAPERTVADTPDTLNQSLFEEGVSLSKTEKEKKTSPTERLVIPLDTNNSSLTGGTTKPRTPTGVV